MNWETIFNYIEDTESQYLDKCHNYIFAPTAHQVVHTSFKFSPSLTYLDLSSCELSSQWRTITSWENWRKLIDMERKTVIYNLDLEDKNQSTRCSPFCFRGISPTEREWALNYEEFPGYIRYHKVSEPEEYDFSDLQTLDRDIVEHLMKSNDKDTLIQQWLPTVTSLEKWIGVEQTGFIYTSFLETLYGTEPRNNLLIDTILVHSISSPIWTILDICYIEAALSTSKMMQTLPSDLFFKGSCGLIIELLMDDDFSKIEMLIRGGLYPLNEGCFNLNKNLDNIRECFYFFSFEEFLQGCIPRDLQKYVTISNELHLTNVDVLILIALHIRIKPKGQGALKILWRCIPNAFLTYHDFQHFFASELLKHENETLNSIYLWYKETVGANGTRSQPRNLKHYCRCVLRQKLRECGNLPIGIEALPIPKSLKSYIRLEH